VKIAENRAEVIVSLSLKPRIYVEMSTSPRLERVITRMSETHTSESLETRDKQCAGRRDEAAPDDIGAMEELELVCRSGRCK